MMRRSCANQQSERSIELRRCVEHIEGTNKAKCLICSTSSKNYEYAAFSTAWVATVGGTVKKVVKKQYEEALAKGDKRAKKTFSFDTQNVVKHLFSTCNEAGLLKLIEVAVLDRGNRDNSAYLPASKKPKLSDDELEKLQTQKKLSDDDLAKLETQEKLDVIEDLFGNTLPSEFVCFCGKSFVKTSYARFSAATKAHISSYCPLFENWRQISLRLEVVEGGLLPNVEECSPFGKWENSKNLAIYYNHLRKLIPLTYPDLFVKLKVSYHGSTIRFATRLREARRCETIDFKSEDMEEVLAGDKEQIHLVEALAQVAFNTKCEVKNSCLELLPILNASKEEVEAGFRTLIRALRHQFEEKASALPKGQLQMNCQQYKDELRRELEERED